MQRVRAHEAQTVGRASVVETLTDRLLRLAACCPICGAPPAIRVHPREVLEKLERPADEVVLTVQCVPCARRKRIVFYPITVDAFRGAA